MKKIALSLAFLSLGIASNSQNLIIPDANFKAYLVGNPLINTNEDTEIQFTEAAAFTGEMLCFNMGISDLTGIEAFPGLTSLICYNNLLTSINLVDNLALTTLNVDNNQLTSLNLSSQTLLTTLYASNNQITTLDLSACTQLVKVFCLSNLLTSINLGNNTNLTLLSCSGNQLTSLSLANNTNLVTLSCSTNQLTSLNLINNVNLEYVFFAENTPLIVVRMRNGNNTAILGFNASSNPNLTCIEVDDAAYSTAYWASIPTTASFSEDCSTASLSTDKPVNQVSIAPNPVGEFATLSGLNPGSTLTIIDISGKILRTINVESEAMSIDCSGWNSGVYLLNIIQQNQTTQLKFFVNR